MTIVKLLEYEQHQSELEASRNPLATVVMAHLEAMETRNDRIERKQQNRTPNQRFWSGASTLTDFGRSRGQESEFPSA
ncbi:MAG: hypothetical protein V7L14_12040 [Nostoc sp.]